MKNTREHLALDIQELDRKRIARDLHDTSLQNLVHIVHKLELASMYIDRDAIQAKLELATISKSINDTIDEIRNIIYDLRPMLFDDLGLKESIERLIDKERESYDLMISSDLDQIEIRDELIGLTIFRIIQESIHNACRHSKGNYVRVFLKNGQDTILITVSDDGIGFDIDEIKKEEKHFGLFIMEERVKEVSGTLKIESSPENGTKITASIPK